MNVSISDEAELELKQAAQWYEDRVPALGGGFLDQILDALDDIAKHPGRYPREPGRHGREIRRLLLDRFPYSIVYEVIGRRVVVLAIAHTARRPGYWKRRRAK